MGKTARALDRAIKSNHAALVVNLMDISEGEKERKRNVGPLWPGSVSFRLLLCHLGQPL